MGVSSSQIGAFSPRMFFLGSWMVFFCSHRVFGFPALDFFQFHDFYFLYSSQSDFLFLLMVR